jgi:hypothetical protein
MAYQRLSNGNSADTGAQAITTVVNSIEVGLEAVEDALPSKAAVSHTHAQGDITNLGTTLAGKSDTSHAHAGVYDPAGSAASAQAAAVQRVNHTGSQTASTISDFNAAVRTNRLDQLAAPTAPVGLNGQRITGLATPTSGADAVTKAYADAIGPGGASLIGGAVLVATANGVVRDGRQATVTISGTTMTATASSGGFSAPYFDSTHVGKTVWLHGPSSVIKRTITAVSSGTQATLDSTPGAFTGINAVYGTDNTAAINALIASATTGQAIVFPPGDLWYLTEGGHVLTTPGLIVEGLHPSYSRLVVPSLTNNLFRVGGARVKVRQLAAHNFAVYAWFAGMAGYAFPTAGAGIRQDDLGVNAHIKAEYDDLELWGFYNCAHTVSGWGAHFRRVWTNAPVADGFLLDSADTDLGDWHVLDCRTYSKDGQYAGVGGAQIKWVAGGDTDIRGNNFQEGGVAVLMAQQVTGTNTSGKSFSTNFRISDNSFEDPTIAGIRWNPAVNMTSQSWVISNNTINSVRAGALAIDALMPSGSVISNWTIIGNTSSITSPIFTASPVGSPNGALSSGRVIGNGHGGGTAADIAAAVNGGNIVVT